MIDASDKKGVAESKTPLKQYLLDDSLHGPILVLGTKTDKPNVVSRVDLSHRLGLYAIDC
jgi:hypothetical protein